MTQNTAHVLSCCAMIAAGVVFMSVQCFMIAPSWPGSPGDGASLHLLVPSLVSACLVSNGCVGLVAFFALSLPCALIYIIGLMANQMLGRLLSLSRRTLATRGVDG
jgi:hypothetical protein